MERDGKHDKKRKPSRAQELEALGELRTSKQGEGGLAEEGVCLVL